MAIHEFNLDALKTFDQGNPAQTFDGMLHRAIKDCTARPIEGRVRKVILQVEMTPLVDKDGLAEDVVVKIQLAEKIPAFATVPVLMKVRKRGQQMTLVFDDEMEDPDEK